MIQWSFGFIHSEFIATDELYEKYVNDQMKEKYDDDYNELAAEFDEDLSDIDEDYFLDSLWDLLFILISNGAKFISIGIFVYIGLTLNSAIKDLYFRTVMKAVVIANFVFFLPALIKIIWFLLVEESYAYEDISNFSPFSLLSLFNTDSIQPWLIYPLKLINVFEILFVVYLIFLITKIASLKSSDVRGYTIASYCLFLFLIISLRTYLYTIF